MQISLPASKYSEPHLRTAFFKQALERVETLSGVISASAVNTLPLSGSDTTSSFTVEGRPRTAADDFSASNRVIDPNYFTTMRMRLLKGRYFTQHDIDTAPSVIIINETLARRFLSGEDPIGKRLIIVPWGKPFAREIVGVVGDVKHSGLSSPASTEIYLPWAQASSLSMTLVLRTASDPARLASAVRHEIAALDKEQPVYDIKTMGQRFSGWLSPVRFYSLLLSLFAVLALILATVGIYAVISYSVVQRTHEIGIRVALGARQSDVLKLVLRKGMAPALVGVAIGLVAALALTRVLASLLYGVSSADPVTFTVVVLLLAAVALLACLIPARRATKVDPMVALRYE